jgi:hypothetical protein
MPTGAARLSKLQGFAATGRPLRRDPQFAPGVGKTGAAPGIAPARGGAGERARGRKAAQKGYQTAGKLKPENYVPKCFMWQLASLDGGWDSFD